MFRHQPVLLQELERAPSTASPAGEEPGWPRAAPRSALSWGLAALSRRPQLGPAPGSGEDILSPARKTELAHVTPAVSVSR